MSVFPANQHTMVVPIYKNSHWFLGIIKQTLVKSTVYILDSLAGNARAEDHNEVLEVVRTCLRKHGSQRSVELVTVQTQMQSNSVDCGAFMLFFIQSFLADPSQLDLGKITNQCDTQDFRSQIRRKLSHCVQNYFQGELGLNEDWECIVKERGYSRDESLSRVLERLRRNMESDPTPTRLISPSPKAYDLRPRRKKLPTPLSGGKAGARVGKVKRGGRALRIPTIDPPEDMLFHIEKFVDSKWFGSPRERMVKYRVRWQGYKPAGDTWQSK